MWLVLTKSRQTPRTVAVWISVLLVTNSCAWTPQVRTPVYEGPEGSVSFITDADPNFHPSHPVDLSLSTMDRVLRGLHIQQNTGLIQGWFSNQPSRQQVFSDDQITWLAPSLQQALTQVTAEEKVRFRANPPISTIRGTVQGTMYHSEKSLVISINGRSNKPRRSSKQNQGSGSGLPAGVLAERLAFSPAHAVREDSSATWLQGGRDPYRLVIDYSMIDGEQPAPGQFSPSEERRVQPESPSPKTTEPVSTSPSSAGDPAPSVLPTTSSHSNEHDLLEEIQELKQKLEEQQAEIDALKERN